MEKMREFVIIFGCAQWAEHIKVGSNPVSQCLQRLVCWYILYVSLYIAHTNTIHRWMDYMEMRAWQNSQTKSLIWGHLIFAADHRQTSAKTKGKKKERSR